MRRARDNDFVMNDKGELMAINLGADYCSEHEWGIKKLKLDFGVVEDKSILGIERRKITIVPEHVYFFRNKRFAILVYDYSCEWRNDITPVEELFLEKLKKGASPYGELTLFEKVDYTKPMKNVKQSEKVYNDMATAWDQESFGIIVPIRNVDKLEAIYKAIQEKDLAIWLGGRDVFRNAGLVLGIVSKVSDECKQTMYLADLEALRLKEETEKVEKETDLIGKLKNSKKEFFSLQSRFASDKWKDKTKYNIIYFLNPMEQHLYKYGWYTVEDLLQWANNEGPIIIKRS